MVEIVFKNVTFFSCLDFFFFSGIKEKRLDVSLYKNLAKESTGSRYFKKEMSILRTFSDQESYGHLSCYMYRRKSSDIKSITSPYKFFILHLELKKLDKKLIEVKSSDFYVQSISIGMALGRCIL